MTENEARIWEERVYAGGAAFVRGPEVVRWTTKAYFMRRFLDLRLSDRVLDVGCGLGEFTMLAACAVKEAVGLDAAPTALAAARVAAARFGIDNASFVEGSAYELAAAVGDRAPFDKLQCFDLLEHLSDPENVLRQMRDLLRPGGRALIYTNCFGRSTWAYWREWARAGGKVGPLWESDRRDHHLARFTPARLREMTAGWRARFVYKNHFLLPLVSAAARLPDRLLAAARRANRGPSAASSTSAGDASVTVQSRLSAPRLILQATTLAASVLEMETLGRLTAGAGVYLLLEKV
jgi:2-polyprenyl-3-methyl-5-hydroxy-6-metoxy-1,4-benzoquinol methylase